MKSILSPSFRYTPAASTDIRKTFERIRKALKIEREEREAAAAEAQDKVKPLVRGKVK